MEQTSLIIRPVLKFLFPSAADVTIDLYHGYIRKSAHFIEYAMLAFLAFRAVSGSSAGLLRRLRMLVPVFFVALVASIDEFHQSFVPSRTSSVLDVLLDVSGGVFAVLVCWFIWREKSSGNAG